MDVWVAFKIEKYIYIYMKYVTKTLKLNINIRLEKKN